MNGSLDGLKSGVMRDRMVRSASVQSEASRASRGSQRVWRWAVGLRVRWVLSQRKTSLV